MNQLSAGTIHNKVPSNMQKALLGNEAALSAWESITPLARNEWICWVVSPKKEETKQDHLRRLIEELVDGVKRPCCWIGCIHRTDKVISPSVQGILNKKSAS